MSGKVIVYEAKRREDGSVYGLGASSEVDLADARQLVDGGSHVCLDPALAEKPKRKSSKKVDDVEGAEVEDGGNR